MISAVVLTRNSAGSLALTLNNLTWCDEVVVVDDYSTDKTRRIAKRFGVKVFRRKLHGDFAAQRNFGLLKAKGEWIVFVDSDEVVPAPLAREIQSVITRQTAHDGYYLKRRDRMFGRWLSHGETGKARLLRLAKKGAGRWVRPVHEVWKVQGIIGELTEPLFHYPHPNVAQFIDEINQYTTINANYLHKKGVRAELWHIVAYPVAKFVKDYCWYLGFLDGTAGAVMAILMSFHSFLTRAKLFVLNHKETQTET